MTLIVFICIILSTYRHYLSYFVSQKHFIVSVREYPVSDYLLWFQTGEERGFNYFFHQHYSALALFAFRITANKAVAEEIAGDALLRLWERREGFHHPLAIRSFLYTASRFASLNFIRNQQRENLRQKQLAYLSDNHERFILQDMISAEVYAEVYQAIQTLPGRCRTIFEMLFIEGQSYEQVARELALSVSTVRNQKARALKLLRKRVDPSIIALIYLFSRSV